MGLSLMSAVDFRSYLLRRGFTRTDKDTALYEAVTDAITILNSRFGFDQQKVDKTTTATITTPGQYTMPVESDLGLLVGVLLQDLNAGRPLILIGKKEFDDFYPWIANDPTFTGYPKHMCVFAGKIYIGPIPDRTSYVYRISYSISGGVVTSSSVNVPFTDLYRDILSDIATGILYEGLDERDTALWYASKAEKRLAEIIRRERINSGAHNFQMKQTDT